MAKNSLLTPFKYVAKSAKGGPDAKRKEGVIQAPSIEDVEDHLFKNGWVALSVEESKGTGLNMEIRLRKERIKQTDLAVWCRQIAVMVNAGIELPQGLGILELQTSNGALKEITNDVKNSVNNGMSFSQALEEYPEVFPPLMIKMIEAAQHGGYLDETLVQISKDIDAEIALKAKVKSAMTYPVVVLIMAGIICVAMLLFVVPTFEELFAGLGGDLPMPTQVLVTMSDGIKVAGIPLVIGIVAFGIWWRKNKHKQHIREFVDPIKLGIPVFGDLNLKIAISRFSRNLSTLVKAGVSLPNALGIVGGTVGNTVIEHAVTDVKARVEQGEAMQLAMEDHDIFDPQVTNMVGVGQETGDIHGMLMKIAEDYDQQIDTKTSQLASLIEPLMIGVLGLVVGGMVIALYMPIFSIYDLIEQ